MESDGMHFAAVFQYLTSIFVGSLYGNLHFYFLHFFLVLPRTNNSLLAKVTIFRTRLSNTKRMSRLRIQAGEPLMQHLARVAFLFIEGRASDTTCNLSIYRADSPLLLFSGI